MNFDQSDMPSKIQLGRDRCCSRREKEEKRQVEDVDTLKESVK